MARSARAVSQRHLQGAGLLILVTVGTTLAFDDLIRFVDGMAERGELPEPVLCQIGLGSYQPKHCEWFRFKPDIAEEIDAASLVIGHGGTGTVTGLLRLGKPFVAVANPAASGDHQRDFLKKLSATLSLVWTDRLEDLPERIQEARHRETRYEAGQHLVADLVEFLQSLATRRGA